MKDTFAAKSFASRTFRPGTWTGAGVTPVATPRPGYQWNPAPKALQWNPAPGAGMASTPLYKDPADIVPMTMNFGRDPLIAQGSCTVTSCTVSVAALGDSTGTVSGGTVALSGGAQSPLCTALMSGGSDSQDYGARYTATLSGPGGNTYTRVLGGLIWVRAEASSE